LQYLRYELANILSQTPFGKGRADEARASNSNFGFALDSQLLMGVDCV